MKRKKYVAAGVQLALYGAGGHARKLLKRYAGKKMRQSVSGLFRKPELHSAAGLTGTKLFVNRISGSGKKQKRKPQRRVKILAGILKYALRETRYS